MKSKPVPQLARAVLGGVLVCFFLFCSFAAFSPTLHEVVHEDANAADHVCHLALWGKHLQTPAPVSLSATLLTEVVLPALQTQHFVCLGDLLTSPTRGPPASA